MGKTEETEDKGWDGGSAGRKACIAGKRTAPQNCPLTSTHVLRHMHTHTHITDTHKHTNEIQMKIASVYMASLFHIN